MKSKGLVRMVLLVFGRGEQFRQKLIFAMQQFQTAVTLAGHAVLKDILEGQRDIPTQLENALRLVKDMLQKLDESRKDRPGNGTEDRCESVQSHRKSCSLSAQGLRELISSEIRAEFFRIALHGSDTVPRPALTVMPPTMANFAAMMKGKYLSDLQIWECVATLVDFSRLFKYMPRLSLQAARTRKSKTRDTTDILMGL
jgi:hypothetical protein